ncbi:MAG: hypothetical protein N3A65_09450 [candidate division WOR-3 bacterium]|nr:hypothetical protein [candidate division WOR-3 bacterium]
MGEHRLRDANNKSEDKQISSFKEIPGVVRLEMALDLTRTAIELIRTGIRQRYPEYNDIEIENAIERIILGNELYEKIYHKC